MWTDAISGGASGAIYGLVGASLLFGVKYRSVLPERVSKALTTGMLPWVVFGIGIGFLDFLPMDNAAHIGGLLAGAALAWVMPSALESSSPWRQRAAQALAAAGILLTVATGVMWAQELGSCASSAEAYKACYPQLDR